MYTPKYKSGFCGVCNAKLPVPTWEYCHIHSARTTVSKSPVNELRPPDRVTYITERSYNKKLPKLILDKKKYKPFKYYMGYEILIPFAMFIEAKTLIYDNDNWTILGYSFE